MVWYKFFVASIVALAFTSCSYNTIDGNTDKTTTVKLNSKFRINLAEDHRTGFTWRLADDYDKTGLDNFNTVWEGNTKGVFYYFKAIKKGETVLNFTSINYDQINAVKSMKVIITD